MKRPIFHLDYISIKDVFGTKENVFVIGVFHTYKQEHVAELRHLYMEPVQIDCTKVVYLVWA